MTNKMHLVIICYQIFQYLLYKLSMSPTRGMKVSHLGIWHKSALKKIAEKYRTFEQAVTNYDDASYKFIRKTKERNAPERQSVLVV